MSIVGPIKVPRNKSVDSNEGLLVYVAHAMIVLWPLEKR